MEAVVVFLFTLGVCLISVGLGVIIGLNINDSYHKDNHKDNK